MTHIILHIHFKDLSIEKNDILGRRLVILQVQCYDDEPTELDKYSINKLLWIKLDFK
ncbi:462_t:CDS:2 [Funneliformis mosseae]|uniref:462_t:CDS:1 n=1 Tax=Funneliformis mosseae TaxID=27381 RepID=A0A9N9BKH5_FUNMO|nr:462_t:CDS:2 [Funneliformis mosseae]